MAKNKNNVVSLKEFKDVMQSLELGYDEPCVELHYDVYLAMMSGDEEILAHAVNTLNVNHAIINLGRLN